MTPDVLSDLSLAIDHEQARRAALTACRFATDTDDARVLLDALGLRDVLRSHAGQERLAG